MFSRLRCWHPVLDRVLAYSRHKVDRYGAAYTSFGLFCCLNFVFPYFMWSHGIGEEICELMLCIRMFGAVLCGLLVVKDSWWPSLLPYLPTFWHLTLLYCITFMSTVMFLVSQGSAEWFTQVAISIFFLIVLVDWTTFLLLTFLGVVFGFLFYTQVVGPVNVQLRFIDAYSLAYQGVFATFIGLLFAHKKERRFDQLAVRNQSLLVEDLENKRDLLEAFRDKVRILQTLRNAGVRDLLQVVKLIRDLHTEVRKQATPLLGLITQLEAVFIPMTLQLRGIEERAANFLQLAVAKRQLKALLEKIQAQVAIKMGKQMIRLRCLTQHQELECDTERIERLLVNSVALLQKESSGQSVLVGVEDTQLHYALPSVRRDYIKKVAALRFVVTTRSKLPALQEFYSAQLNGSELVSPENVQGLISIENQRVVRAHYGYLHSSEDTLCCVIPVVLGEVRPRDFDQPHMELGAVPVRADDHYPGAQEQEKEFLKAVEQESNVDVDLVKSVIELIKWYHGPVNRKSGEPFYLHPMAVAQIVMNFSQDEATILAALLHDVVEDTALLLEDIEAIFGAEAAGIVDTVTHLESTQGGHCKIKLSTEENLLMLVESGNDRVMYVKLADRIHNMRTIGAKSRKSQKLSARETLRFYVPQAKRLNLHAAAEELAVLSMEVLNDGS